jgi:hypothetical protein
MSDQRTFSVPSTRAVEASERGHETFVEGQCDDAYFQMSFEKRNDGRMHIHFYCLPDGAKVRIPRGHQG